MTETKRWEPMAETQVDLKPRADCQDCKWTAAPSRVARGRALQHIRTRGHRVRIITESIEFWQAEPDQPEEEASDDDRDGAGAAGVDADVPADAGHGGAADHDGSSQAGV